MKYISFLNFNIRLANIFPMFPNSLHKQAYFSSLYFVVITTTVLIAPVKPIACLMYRIINLIEQRSIFCDTSGIEYTIDVHMATVTQK